MEESKVGKIIGELIPLVIFLIVAFFTVPKEEKHIERYAQGMTEFYLKLTPYIQELAEKDGFSPEDVDLRHFVDLQDISRLPDDWNYNSYVFFSVARDRGGGLQIGAFGFVFNIMTWMKEETYRKNAASYWRTLKKNYLKCGYFALGKPLVTEWQVDDPILPGYNMD